MKKFLCILCLLLALVCALAACDEPVCQHRDADDNALCDQCGESYTDGVDVTQNTPGEGDAVQLAYAEAQKLGYTGSLDEFLALCKGADGAQGPQGVQGPQGEPGATGADGATIKKVEFDDQGRLVITLTNGTVLDPVEMPEKAEHQHSFDAWLLCGDDNTPCEQRIFYHVCNGCNAMEWKHGTASDHKYVAATYDPTCTEDGYTTHTCSVCGDSFVADRVAATGHSYDAGVVTAPTCTEDGYTTYTCECGHFYTDNEIPATGHSYDKGVITTDPTCTEKGVKTFTCEVCGDSYTEEVAALGHSYDEGVVTTDPTCTEKGVKTFTCGCGDSYTKEVAALDHPDTDGDFACDMCGQAFTEGVTYELSANSTYAIVTGYIGTDNDVVIASTYMGVPVTSIGERAFYKCTGLTSITIPASVTSIGDRAFVECTGLTSITIPAGVTSIGKAAFHFCTGLTSVTFAEDSQLTSIGVDAFSFSGLTSITIPAGVTSIGDCAFFGCGLKAVYFGGTEDDWENVFNHSTIDYQTAATRYYFSAKAPEVAGNYWHYDTDGNPVIW